MKKILTIFLIFVLFIAMILIGGYLYIRFMPNKNISKEAVDFNLTASSLANEYFKNQSASDKKYIDKVIVVKGIISEITTDQNNNTVIILGDNESLTSGILCTIKEKKSIIMKQYKVGDSIKIKGICSGMLFEVVLNNCIIIE